MISVQEAEALILRSIRTLARRKHPFEEVTQKVCGEHLVADRDYPPFDRVAMDGIAIRFDDWRAGRREFVCEGIHRAGEEKSTLRASGSCLEVMTGSTLPSGADCVVRYEDVESENGRARIREGIRVEPWQNVHRQGSDYRASDRVIGPGQIFHAPQVGIAASIGARQIEAAESPFVALISTGDELVDISENPKSHQIRRSNPYAIRAALAQRGMTDTELYHLRDDESQLKAGLERILERHSYIVLSGGVSKGRFDLVPQVLNELGVETVFHGIAQKPGKPMWYGKGRDGQDVFALPGNPVSAVVCCYRYLLPGLLRAMGAAPERRPFARLTSNYRFGKTMTFFLPVSVSFTSAGEILAKPASVNGSGDFISLNQTDGFVELPPEPTFFPEGQAYPLYLWSSFQ